MHSLSKNQCNQGVKQINMYIWRFLKFIWLTFRSGQKSHLLSRIKHRYSQFDSIDEMKLILEVLFLAVGLCVTNGASVDSAKPLGIGQYTEYIFPCKQYISLVLPETCTWSGTSPICEGKCSENEITLATSQCKLNKIISLLS